MAQYPLDMGRKKKMSNALAIQVDAEGKIKYDAIARQGQSKDKVIFPQIHRLAVYLEKLHVHIAYTSIHWSAISQMDCVILWNNWNNF